MLHSYFVREGRVHQLAMTKWPNADFWGVDTWALELPTPIDVMAVNSFPIVFWRDDLPGIREHLGRIAAAAAPTSPSSSSTSPSEPPPRCAFASPFDSAFARMASSEPRYGRDHVNPGFSQFNIMANWAFWKRPERYAFHAVFSTPEDAEAVRSRRAQALIIPADEETNGGEDPFPTKVSRSLS